MFKKNLYQTSNLNCFEHSYNENFDAKSSKSYSKQGFILGIIQR